MMTIHKATNKVLELLLREKGAAFVNAGVVFRSADGHICFAVDFSLPEEEEERLSKMLAEQVPYCSDTRSVRGGRPAHIFDDPTMRYDVRYLSQIVDRFIIGADWNSYVPRQKSGNRFAFWSPKDGATKTLVAVETAVALAQAGLKVLLVDMDLEAPSAAEAMPSEWDLAPYGVTDYLLMQNFQIPCDMKHFVTTDARHPNLHFVSAVGQEDRKFPKDYRGKLSRALLEDVRDGKVFTIADKLARLLQQLEQETTYDVVLLDAPCGVTEIAAGPLRHLNAQVVNVVSEGYCSVDCIDERDRFRAVVDSKAATAIVLRSVNTAQKGASKAHAPQ